MDLERPCSECDWYQIEPGRFDVSSAPVQKERQANHIDDGGYKTRSTLLKPGSDKSYVTTVNPIEGSLPDGIQFTRIGTYGGVFDLLSRRISLLSQCDQRRHEQPEEARHGEEHEAESFDPSGEFNEWSNINTLALGAKVDDPGALVVFIVGLTRLLPQLTGIAFTY